ncbi:hypothetical protein DSM100238_0312 [Bifidobacterium apri]|uniref:Uncharacterized protein n=1 Tax=Bifidobacterium apri TaxID=1769423 RepID=A0A6A2VI75_9BIFI|nr:hypothetical protein DSM100238_0312 [Bifidobacterium apri]
MQNTAPPGMYTTIIMLPRPFRWLVLLGSSEYSQNIEDSAVNDLDCGISHACPTCPDQGKQPCVNQKSRRGDPARFAGPPLNTVAA